ncbi:MAG TPA: hypothetical protein VGD42_15350 [Lysobacter sp.]
MIDAGMLALMLGLAQTAGPPAHATTPLPLRFLDPGLFRQQDEAILRSEGFESHHPDLRFRRLGLQAQQRGDAVGALAYYRRAARYADKLSQAAIAELYWNGALGAPDRVQGYVWMDLAAERGAPLMLAHRERYWRALSAAEREGVDRLGPALYEQFGDPVAKPRLERELRRGLRAMTGSRVGIVGNLSICLRRDAGECDVTVRGEHYYADLYWKPERYWAWQDGLLRTPSREDGRVEVGPVQPAAKP